MYMYSPLNVYNSDSHVDQYTCTKHYDKCFIDLSLFRVVILSRQGVRIINVLSRGCHITWRPGYPFDTMIGKSLCILDRQHCLWHEPCFFSVHVDNDSNKLHVLSYRKHFDWPSFPCARSTIRVVFSILFNYFSKIFESAFVDKCVWLQLHILPLTQSLTSKYILTGQLPTCSFLSQNLV